MDELLGVCAWKALKQLDNGLARRCFALRSLLFGYLMNNGVRLRLVAYMVKLGR